MHRPVFGPSLAALLATILAAGCAAGPTSPPTAVSTPTASPIDTPASVPSDPESTDTVYEDFVPPTPLCPAPVDAVKPPVMTASVKGGQPRPADMGSSTVMTCSTVGSDDRVVPEPKAPILAKRGDVVVFTLSPGWQILAWQASAKAANVEDSSIVPSTLGLGQRTAIEMPEQLAGDSIVAVDAWCMRDDGRAIAHVTGFAWVRASG